MHRAHIWVRGWTVAAGTGGRSDCRKQPLLAELVERLGRVPHRDDAPSFLDRPTDVKLAPFRKLVTTHHLRGNRVVHLRGKAGSNDRHDNCHPEGKAWYRAIYDGEEPVGFVMLSWDVTPVPGKIIGPWFLWKLLIAERHQRRGCGRAALLEVIEIVRNAGATELLTSYTTGEGEPWPFYERLGFVPTGERDDAGEVILSLDASRR